MDKYKKMQRKISQIKSAFPLISAHLAILKRRIAVTKLKQGNIDQVIEDEIEALEPLLRQLNKQRKRISEHDFYKI